jgi:hypothetical protein
LRNPALFKFRGGQLQFTISLNRSTIGSGNFDTILAELNVDKGFWAAIDDIELTVAQIKFIPSIWKVPDYMAKLLSQVATVIRGSIGGVTFSANQFSPIIARAKTAPVNPRTTNQSIMRSAFSGACNDWNSLTDALRTGWGAYADTLQFEGPLGSYSVPGRQVMVGNLALVNYINARGLAAISKVTTAPIFPGFLNIDSVVTATPASGTGVGVSISQSSPDDIYALVEISVPFNPARGRFQGPFQSETAQCVLCATSSSTLISFDGLAEDLIYFIRVRCVSAEPQHRVSPEYILRMAAVDSGV